MDNLDIHMSKIKKKNKKKKEEDQIEKATGTALKP